MIRPYLLLLPVVLSAQVTPPASAVFDKDAVHEIRLTFKQANWFEQLTSDYDMYPDDTPYREASLVWGESKFDTVGVRFKGNSSYRGATTKKKPFPHQAQRIRQRPEDRQHVFVRSQQRLERSQLRP